MATKTLRICLFQDLPKISERDFNYLYLTYDKLLLFFGQNMYYDPYVISESMPSNPAVGYLYILFNGDVKIYNGSETITIATIEDEEQLAHIDELGTTFFIHADKRYLDLQRRTLQLPFHNGTYSLSLSLAKHLKINEKTVIRFDPKSEQFYIDGEYEPHPPDLRFYEGEDSKTVSLSVVDHSVIKADVKLSEDEGNVLEVQEGGLYANMGDKALQSDYEALLAEYEEYKSTTGALLDALQASVLENEELITQDSIYTMVVNSVSEYYENIQNLIDEYESITDDLSQIEIDANEYTDEQFSKAKEEINTYITESLSAVWSEF